MTTNQRGKIEISAGGILLLGVATLVATGIVFLLGIYVGKGMVEQRLQQESRVVRLPVPTPGTGNKSDEGDVTFWDKLGKGGEPTPRAATPRTPTAAEPAVRFAPSTPAQRAAEPRQAEPQAAAPAPPPAKAPVVEGGSYQVQVNAVGDKARAEELVRDLEGKGYHAFISSAKAADKTLYRVRVGNLPSAAAAKEAVARLREQGFPNAFLAAEVNE